MSRNREERFKHYIHTDYVNSFAKPKNQNPDDDVQKPIAIGQLSDSINLKMCIAQHKNSLVMKIKAW